MVLAELGGSIARALARMSNATVVDEKVLADCLNEICRALLQADVRFDTVRDVKANINRIVNLDALAAGTNKRRIIQQVRTSRAATAVAVAGPNSEPTERAAAGGRRADFSVACLQAVVDELRRMLDPGKPSFTPSKGKPNVVMFVGLQGQYRSSA
jgi:signal recognition particle subunit SRP54